MVYRRQIGSDILKSLSGAAGPKVAKAQELGVELLDEAQFCALLEAPQEVS
jgi:hypothetical protein